MQTTKPLLKTTFRDVRVMDQTPEKEFVTTSSIAIAFALALRKQFERLAHFVSRDLIFRRAQQNVTLQQRFSYSQINVTPHLLLSAHSEKYYRIVERKERREINLSAPHFESAPAVERILRRLELQKITIRTGVGSEELKLTPRPHVEINRSGPMSFTPVEMVTYQPRRATSVPVDPVRNNELPQPRIDQRPIEQGPRSALTADQINIRQLTDQVVEVLDRRLFASQERLTRR